MTNRELWWDIYKQVEDTCDDPYAAADRLFAEITKRFPDIPSAEIELLIAKSRSKLMRKLREKILEAQAVALDGQVLNLTPMTQIIDMFITFADLYDPTGKEIPSNVS